MADELKSIDFKPLGRDYPEADTLRAVRHAGRAVLIVSRTTSTPPVGAQTTFASLEAANAAGGWINVASVRQIVPAQPAWDVAADSRGQFQIVYEKAGGAINALVVRAPTGDTRVLTGEYSMKSFSLPRFAKPSEEAPSWVTAIVDNRTCVTLPLAQAGPYHELGECAEGMLVKTGLGFVFLFKKTVPGIVRSNNIAPGQLQAMIFGTDLRSSGRPVEVVAGTIFQFDADTVGGKLVVAATTPGGLVIASTAAANLRFNRKEYAAPATLTSPAMLPATGGKVMLIALDKAGSSRAQIVATEISVP